jgi:two-component system, NarL family, response regulator LiaR
MLDDDDGMTKQVLIYGVGGGVLIALLKMIEYKHFVHEYPGEVYGGLLAVIFTVVGVYLGLKWTGPPEGSGGHQRSSRP